MSMSKVDDLIGKRVGKLTVLKRTKDYISPNGVHGIQYICECNCENHSIVTVRRCNLKSGATSSCGCEWQKRMSEVFSKYNKYNLEGDYGIGYTSNTNEEFYFDLEDHDKIKSYCWYQDKKEKYIKSNTKNKNDNPNKNSHTLLLHRTVIECNEKDIIDHINRNRVDCRKNNLRKVDNFDNARNRSISSNNLSGYIGVFYDKERKKWSSQLIIKDKKIYFKRFDSKEEAIKARLEAELKYFGKDFAPQRHLFEQYGIMEKYYDN